MAKFIIDEPLVEVNGVDLSCNVREAEITLEYAEVDLSTYCGQETGAGLDESSITVTFLQDYTAASVDATLRDLWTNKTKFPIVIRPDKNSAASITNPEYSGTALILSYTPFSGAQGDAVEFDVEFHLDGSIAIATA